MKKCLMVLLCISMAIVTHAQIWDEWFNQTATQKKYLIQQIAALKVYIGYLQKGYSIAKKGLNTIGNIKDGHFSLDKDFFASLHNINPKVKQYAKVADIIAINIQIVQTYKRTTKNAEASLLLTSNEINYLNTVFEKLIEGCSNLADQLIAVITPDKLQMSDDERIKCIDGIYAEMRERFVFANSFDNDARILSLQRSKEQKDTKTVSSLYENQR